MCGLLIGISRTRIGRFTDALSALSHRGPDATQVLDFAAAGWSVAFGHNRLSIVDTREAANQPMVSRCGNFILVFNGELYNHSELRKKLYHRGENFRTWSDSEVLLYGLAREGLDFLTKVNGMFAFGFMDRRKNVVIFARDAFGIKPLYYTRSDDGGIIAGSEIRALQIAGGKRLRFDHARLAEFLLNGFVYEPATGFVDIHKVPPGSALVFDLNTATFDLRRWHRRFKAQEASYSIEETLRRQVDLEVQADVPVGLFFSGGIDSTVIASLAPKSAVGFFAQHGDDNIGEKHVAMKIAESVDIELKIFDTVKADQSAAEILEEFRSVARGTEELISDFTYTATRLLSRSARNHGYKVVLSGMGGDEFYGGYPRYIAARHWDLIKVIRPLILVVMRIAERFAKKSKRISRLVSFIEAKDFIEAYTALIGYFNSKEVAEMLGATDGVEAFYRRQKNLLDSAVGMTRFRQAMELDRHGFLAHNLTVTDKASMAEGVEIRVPLLNVCSDSLIADIKDNLLVSFTMGKIPLRNIFGKYAPRNYSNLKKSGFNPPLDRKIFVLGEDICIRTVTTGRIAEFIDSHFASNLVSDHFRGLRNNTYRIWQLIYFSLWLEEWENSHPHPSGFGWD